MGMWGGVLLCLLCLEGKRACLAAAAVVGRFCRRGFGGVTAFVRRWAFGRVWSPTDRALLCGCWGELTALHCLSCVRLAMASFFVLRAAVAVSKCILAVGGYVALPLLWGARAGDTKAVLDGVCDSTELAVSMLPWCGNLKSSMEARSSRPDNCVAGQMPIEVQVGSACISI